jgi:GNAT superfamily N-acetyltransferase
MRYAPAIRHIGFVFKCWNQDYGDSDDWQTKHMIDCSLIRLIPADETHREFSYQVKKAAEGDYITSMFGWDEDVQRDFHVRAWQEQKPDIITYDGKLIGTIATVESQDRVEIGQFFILPEYQGKGIGTHLLRSILDKADRSGRNVTLKFLKNNPVKSLYVRNGFRLVRTSEVAHHMERKIGGGSRSL